MTPNEIVNTLFSKGDKKLQPKIRLISLTFALLLLIPILTCWGQGKKEGPGSVKATPELKGTIRVSGAWALYPMMVKWGEEFGKAHPKVRVDISAGGAGKGVADALAGLVDLGMVSSEVVPEEIKQGAFYIPVV